MSRQSALTRYQLLIREQRSLPPTAKLVALTLSTYMDTETLMVHHLSYATLAEKVGEVHPRTVRRNLRLLETLGLLYVNRGRFKGSASSFRGVLNAQRGTPVSAKGDTHVPPTCSTWETAPEQAPVAGAGSAAPAPQQIIADLIGRLTEPLTPAAQNVAVVYADRPDDWPQIIAGTLIPPNIGGPVRATLQKLFTLAMEAMCS